MKNILLCCLFIGFVAQPVLGQEYPTKYRPSNLNWQQLATPHFKIVFPDGEDSAAYRTARILEHEYPRVQQLVGGELANFPVVLNNFNDRSNGFVTTWHFRSEIEIPSIKGKAMNPQSGNWLETVVPHELVHALQDSHLDGIWANILKVFSPDMARSLHGSIPAGVAEGIATYHETVSIAPDGGRGNYPYFTNQFEAVFNSSKRWSLGQMLSISSYSRPFNRHYIGGYEFTDWLQQAYGDSTTNQALDFFIRWPFLGYGTALRHETGHWPGQLYDQFKADHEKQMRNKEGTTYQPLSIPYSGAEMHRPVWLSEDELLMHGSFYNSSSGFYRYSLTDDRFIQLKETRTVQDYNYDLSADRSRLLFANNVSSAKYDNTYKMDLHELDLSSGSVDRLSRKLRAYAPVYHSNGYFALQTDHTSSALVQLRETGDSLVVAESISLPNTEFVSVTPNPQNAHQIAVIANRRGLQGIWLVDDISSIRKQMTNAPDISFMGGSVFDVAWHPSGDQLMFSSGHTGTMQLYEYDVTVDEVKQITDASYNAMEGSYSPEGDRIAFIIQHKNEHLPVVMKRSEHINRPVGGSMWKSSAEKEKFMARKELGSDLQKDSSSWKASKYRPGLSWLSPRTIMPTVDQFSNSNSLKAGLSLSSNDLLLRNAYTLDLSYAQDRLWYDLSYRHSGFFPGFELNTFNNPSFRSFQLPDNTSQSRFLRKNVGASVGIPTRFVLEDNVRFSSLRFTPSLKMQGIRFYELGNTGTPVSDYANIISGNMEAVFNYKLQQNIRDLQPNSGLVLFSELEHAFSATSTAIQTPNYQIELNPSTPTALRSGMYLFTAPLKRWNQSLRLGVQGLTQTAPTFDNQSLVSGGFSEPIFPTARHMMSLSTRYTIPLWFPDKGGFTYPGYLSSIYLVGFSNTVTDLERHAIADFFDASRTVLGLGIRSRFRLSNLTFDLGIGIGFEPARNELNPFVGNF